MSYISLQRIFRITEVFIIFVGVDAINGGLSALASYYFKVDLGPYDMFIALLYIIFVYEVFIRGGKKEEPTVEIAKEEIKLQKQTKKKNKKL